MHTHNASVNKLPFFSCLSVFGQSQLQNSSPEPRRVEEKNIFPHQQFLLNYRRKDSSLDDHVLHGITKWKQDPSWILLGGWPPGFDLCIYRLLPSIHKELLWKVSSEVSPMRPAW